MNQIINNEKILNFLVYINDILYGYILVFLLIFAGIYFSIITKFIQIKSPTKSLSLLKIKSKNALSPLESFALTTAARVGIGNIIGVSMAVSTGGAGAIFWMWVVAFLGGASAFCESTLAQVYKVKDENGYKGGPAYYIRYGLGFKKLSILFAVFLIAADLIGFNGVLGHSISAVIYDVLPTTIQEQSLTKIIIGIVVSGFALLMFLKYGVRLSLYFVPFMSILYFALAFWVFFTNFDKTFKVLEMIFESAFDYEAIFGGFFGSAVVIGAKRGLFSNEAGMGSAPNAAASAKVSHPCDQGFVQSFSVLCDLLVCSATGVLVLFSNSFGKINEGDKLIKAAMSEYFGEFGFYLLSFFILLFGLSSFFGNYYYSLANLKFISTKKIYFYIFNIVAVLCVFVGTQLDLKIVWNTADFLMALMSILNIICVAMLSKVLLKTLKNYKDKKAFNSKKLMIENAPCWEDDK